MSGGGGCFFFSFSFIYDLFQVSETPENLYLLEMLLFQSLPLWFTLTASHLACNNGHAIVGGMQSFVVS